MISFSRFGVPPQLRDLDQWLLWRYEDRGGPKPTKVPFSAKGGPGKSNDPSTWAKFNDAVQVLDQGNYSGLGLALCEGDGLVGIDLDHCLEDGKVPEGGIAYEIVDRFRHCAYVERSPSGEGLRLFTYGKARRSGKGALHNWIEVYDYRSPRYLTITGSALLPSRLGPGQEALDWLHDTHMKKEEVAPTPRPAPTRPSDLSDRELLERAENAANGSEFRRLYNGDAGADHSSADLAFCNMLAFWTRCDAGQMDRIFRGSGLMRPKWDRNAGQGRTYGERTIERAISDCREVYEPQVVQPQRQDPVAVMAPVEPSDEPDYNPYALVKGGADDEGNAQLMHRLYGDQFLHCEAYGWLAWTGTHWERIGAESRLERAVVDALKRRRAAAVEISNEHVIRAAKPSATNVRSTKFLFKSLVEMGIGAFDADPDLLNVKNGIVHLPTGELRPHDPTQYMTYCIGVDYDQGASAERWLSFLRSTVHEGSEEIIRYLQRSVGYGLTGHTSEEVLWYIYGPSRSGKGTFTETILSILGVPLSTEVDFSTFTRDRDNDASNFDLAPLKPARLIFASESERHQRLNGSKLKALTGGNSIQCCFKHRDHFSYKPQYKIWLTSNHPPNADVDDDAVWGRLRVLVFPNGHLGSEDKGLKQRMRERDSLVGVLAWAVDGARQWYSERGSGLIAPAHVVEVTQQVRAEQDTVAQWIEECVEVTDDIVPSTGKPPYLSNAELYTNYANWCEENGVTPKKQKALTQAINGKGIEGPRVTKELSKTIRAWHGLRWKAGGYA